jgi:hypothetical protein
MRETKFYQNSMKEFLTSLFPLCVLRHPLTSSHVQLWKKENISNLSWLLTSIIFKHWSSTERLCPQRYVRSRVHNLNGALNHWEFQRSWSIRGKNIQGKLKKLCRNIDWSQTSYKSSPVMLVENCHTLAIQHLLTRDQIRMQNQCLKNSEIFPLLANVRPFHNSDAESRAM